MSYVYICVRNCKSKSHVHVLKYKYLKCLKIEWLKKNNVFSLYFHIHTSHTCPGLCVLHLNLQHVNSINSLFDFNKIIFIVVYRTKSTSRPQNNIPRREKKRRRWRRPEAVCARVLIGPDVAERSSRGAHQLPQMEK